MVATLARHGTSWHRERDVRVLSVEKPKTESKTPFNQTKQTEMGSEHKQKQDKRRNHFITDDKESKAPILEEGEIMKRQKNQHIKSLSLEISSSMHKTLKILALEQDDTLNSIVVEALKQFIKNDEQMTLKAEALRRRLS